jgi:hypothetical protein
MTLTAIDKHQTGRRLLNVLLTEQPPVSEIWLDCHDRSADCYVNRQRHMYKENDFWFGFLGSFPGAPLTLFDREKTEQGKLRGVAGFLWLGGPDNRGAAGAENLRAEGTP